MLKRDAIEILKSIQDNLEETRFLEKCAIDMGIEALKREKRALQLKSIVRNIDGWENIVKEVARLEAEERR